MIKRLHLLVVKSYIGPLILTFFIAEFVLIMQFLWLYIEDLVGKGLEWTIVAELLIYAAAGLVKMALPLAILLASIMTFGNFGEHFELSAMKSAGLSLQRIMMPLIIFSVFLSIASFFWSNNVIPYTNLKTGSLLYDIGNQRPELNIKPGIFNRDIEGYSIKIKSKSQNSPMMYDFMIYDHRDRRGNVKVTLADSGSMELTDNQKYMVITLYGGKAWEEMPEKNQTSKLFPERHETFDKQTIILELKGFDLEHTDETLFKHHYQMKTISELENWTDSVSQTLASRKKQFVTSLNRSRYFKFEPRPNDREEELPPQAIEDTNTAIIDTQRVAKKETPDMKKVFSSLSPSVKEKALNDALENAKSTKAYIESNKTDIEDRERNINKHNIAWHEKFTLSFACLIFFFIGAPLGAIIRKGGFGMPFLVSIIFFMLYYVVSLSGRKLVEESVLVPWQGMWLSSLLTLPLGILFTYKATTDSVLFDITSYSDYFKKIFKGLDIQYKDPSIVFHKDVIMPETQTILATVKNQLNHSYQIKNTILEHIKSRNNLYMSHFEMDFSDLRNYIENYNALYAILAVKFRDRKFLKAQLEKFPKIDFGHYHRTKKKLIANFVLLSIGIFPVGLLLMIRSYLKYKVLKQKIELVEDGLKTFKDTLNQFES